MEARELMYMDWVNHNGNPRRIRGAVDFTFAKDFEPIPLTPERLKLNGFRESSIEQGCYYFPEKYQELNDRGFAVEEDDEGRFWITDHQLMKTRYLHKFQHALRLCGLNELAENFKVNIMSLK